MNNRFAAITVSALAVVLLSSCATGAAHPSDEEDSSMTSSPTIEGPILQGTSLLDIFPTTKDYTAYNSGLSWEAQSNQITADQLVGLKFSDASATAAIWGADCAAAMSKAASIPFTITEAAAQQVSPPGESESVEMFRFASSAEANSVLTSLQTVSLACSENQGVAHWTPVDLRVDNSVGWQASYPSVDLYFFGFVQRGDLLVAVTNDDANADGPTTLRFVSNHIDDMLNGK